VGETDVTIEDGKIGTFDESGKNPGSLFLSVLAMLLGFAVLGFFVDGVAIVFFPSEHSRFIGWVFLLGSTAVGLILLHRWIKYLPVLFGYGVLNGIVLTVSGHLPGSASIPVSRPMGLLAITFCIAGAVLSFTFKERTLYPIDRIAVAVFVFGFAYGAIYDSDESAAVRGAVPHELVSFVLLGVGLCALFVAWAYDRFRRRAVRPRSTRSTTSTSETAEM
jgi:hypothetical protein